MNHGHVYVIQVILNIIMFTSFDTISHHSRSHWNIIASNHAAVIVWTCWKNERHTIKNINVYTALWDKGTGISSLRYKTNRNQKNINTSSIKQRQKRSFTVTARRILSTPVNKKIQEKNIRCIQIEVIIWLFSTVSLIESSCCCLIECAFLAECIPEQIPKLIVKQRQHGQALKNFRLYFWEISRTKRVSPQINQLMRILLQL